MHFTVLSMFDCSYVVQCSRCRYLTEHIPELAVLPVTVSLSLLNKGIQIPDVRLKPQDRYAAYIASVV